MSYTAESASTSRTYHLQDFTDSSNALAALISYVPVSIYVANYLCVLPEFDITPVFSDPAHTLFEGTVTWNTPDKADGGKDSDDEPKEPEDNTSFSFGFSALSDIKLHVTGDTKSVGVKGFSQTGMEYAINRQHPELQPEGVAYNRAIVTMTGKTVVSTHQATNEWFKDRLDQVWTLNQSEWRSLPAKSVAFTGMNGTRRKDGHWDITYNFEYRPLIDGYNIEQDAGNIPIPQQTGWQYLWAEYTKQTQTTDQEDNTAIVRREIKFVHIQDLYDTSNFSNLGMVGV
jgi:hypothetical protein